MGLCPESGLPPMAVHIPMWSGTQSAGSVRGVEADSPRMTTQFC